MAPKKATPSDAKAKPAGSAAPAKAADAKAKPTAAATAKEDVKLTGTMDDHPEFVTSISAFLRAHCVFQSSVKFESTMSAVRIARDLNAVFEAPLKHQIIDMGGAINFAFFLSHAEDQLPLTEDEGEPPLDETQKLDLKAAHKRIASVYDDGIAADFQSYLDEDEEEEDGEGEDADAS